jgi:hypothetical protein
MKKRIVVLLLAAVMAISAAVPAFAAGSWQKDGQGWWYLLDDGNYYKRGWQWIDGKCYYFDHMGYCLLNTVTPDGYTVDTNGAWIMNGEIQYQ